MQRRVVATGGAFSLLVAALVGCGARTELLVRETCRTAGETRTCQDGCGAGSQTCTDGFWSACAVPDAFRNCSDACGTGTESCHAGVWSACEVPVATKPCFDECGQGEDSCLDGAWRGCEVPDVKRSCESVCGPGDETCRGGKWGRCDAPLPKPPKLKSTVRDFSPKTHPDFEASYAPGLDLGIVRRQLGDDSKPVYRSLSRTPSTSGVENFDKWFHDDASASQSSPLDLQLKASADDAALFVYDNHAFFPIDGELLGNEGRNHNFHFTLEASTYFQYIGGETFSFSGDDDMWVFINRQLAIDLGGLHSSLSAEVALDEIASDFGLVQGESYDLHFFFAERHTIESNFTIKTSIAEPGSCD